jgi:hypothetical protein
MCPPIIKEPDFITFLLKYKISYMPSYDPAHPRFSWRKTHGYSILSRPKLKSISSTSRIDPLPETTFKHLKSQPPAVSRGAANYFRNEDTRLALLPELPGPAMSGTKLPLSTLPRTPRTCNTRNKNAQLALLLVLPVLLGPVTPGTRTPV